MKLYPILQQAHETASPEVLTKATGLDAKQLLEKSTTSVQEARNDAIGVATTQVLDKTQAFKSFDQRCLAFTEVRNT